MATEKESVWKSIHASYIRWAVQSYRECEEEPADLVEHIYGNRKAIEAIRYAYDSLEASVNYLYHMGELKQLPIKIQENWLTRHLKRHWEQQSVCERIGMLAFAWTKSNFWETNDCLRLFEDLRQVRGGLTHPKPFGKTKEYEILERKETDEGVYTKRISIGDTKLLEPKLLKNNKPLADFCPEPGKLNKRDAGMAIEIMLVHLIRLDNLFCGGHQLDFAFYEDSDNNIVSANDLLLKHNRSFSEFWV